MFSPLSPWIDRSHPLPERFYDPNRSSIIDQPNVDWDVWVGLEEVAELHQASSLKWISFKQSRRRTDEYLSKADPIISGLSGGWLDREEKSMIVEKLGEPPKPCLPIYIISTEEGGKEVIAYVGKTKSNSRFAGGHSAALKLLAPSYSSMIKRIYRCSVWFNFNDEYISLEWIQPESLALKLLDSIESQLIFNFQPPLNTDKKKKDRSVYNFTLQLQNMEGREFLNEVVI